LTPLVWQSTSKPQGHSVWGSTSERTHASIQRTQGSLAEPHPTPVSRRCRQFMTRLIGLRAAIEGRLESLGQQLSHQSYRPTPHPELIKKHSTWERAEREREDRLCPWTTSVHGCGTNCPIKRSWPRHIRAYVSERDRERRSERYGIPSRGTDQSLCCPSGRHRQHES
jgi:hypothetical protein